MKEYRMCCSKFPARGHEKHAYRNTTDLRSITQSIINSNHDAEMHPDGSYADEAPYFLEVREVGEWESVAPIGAQE